MKISMISMVPGIHNYGLRIISACLKQAGHDATLFFLMKEYHKKYSETAMNNLVELTKGSDMVGISVMTNFFDNAIHITQKLRNNYDFPILWGGIHPTIRSEESLVENSTLSRSVSQSLQLSSPKQSPSLSSNR